jgi:hypothetical protein
MRLVLFKDEFKHSLERRRKVQWRSSLRLSMQIQLSYFKPLDGFKVAQIECFMS